jgi:hypothetical protein
VVEVKVPVGHSVADVAPAPETNEPAGAGVHGAYPVAEYDPAEHWIASPVPLSPTLCMALAWFRLLSVRITEPVFGPAAVGSKSIATVQFAPPASEYGEPPEATWRQVEVLSHRKPGATLGFNPELGTAKRSGWLPTFATVKPSALSVESSTPTAVVVGKVSVAGGVDRSISFTALLL